MLGVLKAIDELKTQGFKVSKQHILSGLENTIANTGLLGRWQVLQKQPLVICEASHNEDGIKQTLQQLKNIDFNNLHIVIGMVSDKDVAKILELLPKKATYYFCNAQLERALPANELQKKANQVGLVGAAYSSIEIALKEAIKNSQASDLILVTGSIFVIAEII